MINRDRPPDVTIAGVTAGMGLRYFAGILHQITLSFKSNAFGQVVEALREKYGKPEIQTEKVQNRMGAQYENHTLTWRKPGIGKVLAIRYAGSLTDSIVFYQSDNYEQEYKKRNPSKSKDL